MEITIWEAPFKRKGCEPKPALRYYIDGNTDDKRTVLLKNVEELTGEAPAVEVEIQKRSLIATIKQKKEIEKNYVKRVVPKKSRATAYENRLCVASATSSSKRVSSTRTRSRG